MTPRPDLADELSGLDSDVPAQEGSRRHRRRDPLGVILGVVGELLITAGVFLGLFVVWQVWWTDIQARSHTSGVVAELGFESQENVIDDSAKNTGPPPVGEVPDGAYAVLHVPAFGPDYKVPVMEGIGLEAVLHQGFAGHYPDTAQVGEVGNFALAGHRQSHGAIFLHVDQLQEGDPLIVQTADTWYVYRVTSHQIVDPTQVDVIAPNPVDPSAPAEQPMMTLTTCHPLWSIAERYIVHAELDYWAPTDAGTPAEMGQS